MQLFSLLVEANLKLDKMFCSLPLIVLFSVFLSVGETGVTANHVRDKFKVLLQSGFIRQSVITSQGVAHSSSEPASVPTVSAPGKSLIMRKLRVG